MTQHSSQGEGRISNTNISLHHKVLHEFPPCLTTHTLILHELDKNRIVVHRPCHMRRAITNICQFDVLPVSVAEISITPVWIFH